MKRAAEKLTEVEENLFINEATLSHMEKAMANIATKKEEQIGLEETIFEVLKDLEAKGAYTKNDPITRESCKEFVEVIVSHAKNWVNVARDRKGAIRFHPKVLGACMNQYLRCPAAAKQFRRDNCLVQPSPGYMKKIKGEQKISDGFCVEMLIPQEMYRGMGTFEWGQIGFDELSISQGIVHNVRNNEITGMSKDM